MRRLAQLRRANGGRRREQCGQLNSCEAAVVGGDHHLGCSPPVEVWFTGGNHSSDGAISHRKTALCWLALLRRANAGRPNSCEAAVVGGGHHLGSSPPAEVSFAGGNHSSDGASSHRKTVLRWLAQLQGANAGRRRMSCGWTYSCEADVVGGNRHLGSSTPAEVWFIGGGGNTDDNI